MKTAYVTGADRGLGHALTMVLLGYGYRVYAGQYMLEWGELSVLKEEYGDNLIILPLDISSLKQVKAAAKMIKAKEKSLDLLFNVAAIAGSLEHSGTIFDKFTEKDYKECHQLYDVNTLGALRVTQSVINLIEKGEQKIIINISSEAGSIGGNWRSTGYAYCMSKAALNMQSAILQHSVAHLGIKVLCVHPGWLRSYMSGELNEKATEEPMDVAHSIMGLLSRKEMMSLASPMYFDYRGTQMAW